MLNKAQIVDIVDSWLSAQRDRLNEEGYVVRVTRSPHDRNPESIWLILEGGSRIAEMVVWTNGSVDIRIMPMDSDDIVASHHEVDDLADLRQMLGLLLK
jgi:hypothetical protein